MVKIPIAIKDPIPEDFAKELVYVISEEFKMIGCTVENKLPFLYKIDGCSDLVLALLCLEANKEAVKNKANEIADILEDNYDYTFTYPTNPSDLDALAINGCFYIVNMKKPNPVGLFEEEN